MSKNPGRHVTEYDCISLFSKAWYRTVTIPNIMSAFRTTGVYPFDYNAIEVIDSTPHINNCISLTERTGLAFIPLYSPNCKSSAPSCKTITKPPVTFISEKLPVSLEGKRKDMTSLLMSVTISGSRNMNGLIVLGYLVRCLLNLRLQLGHHHHLIFCLWKHQVNPDLF